jgi:hypothetical protein
LLKHSEFFAKLRSQKREFAAVFRKEAAKPFDEIWRARLDINHAVDAMVRTDTELKIREEDKKLWKEHYYTAFSSPREAEDHLTAKITKQVEALEACCRPATEANNNRHVRT